MKPIVRRFIAGATVVGGLIVIYFELFHSPSSESWFWVAVAALAVVLGVIELVSPSKPEPPGPLEPPE